MGDGVSALENKLEFIKECRTAWSKTKAYRLKILLSLHSKNVMCWIDTACQTKENKYENINCWSQCKKERTAHIICLTEAAVVDKHTVKRDLWRRFSASPGILSLLHHNQRMVLGHLIKPQVKAITKQKILDLKLKVERVAVSESWFHGRGGWKQQPPIPTFETLGKTASLTAKCSVRIIRYCEVL